jgi:hypothetical protein
MRDDLENLPVQARLSFIATKRDDGHYIIAFSLVAPDFSPKSSCRAVVKTSEIRISSSDPWP